MTQQLPLFPGLEPKGMWFRCECGAAEAYPFSVVAKFGPQPAGAVSIRAEICSTCQPKALMYPWVWVLDDGTEAHCLAGVDTAEAAGAADIASEMASRRAKARKQRALEDSYRGRPINPSSLE